MKGFCIFNLPFTTGWMFAKWGTLFSMELYFLTGKPSRFTLLLLSYWVSPGLLVSSNHFHGTQPKHPGREDRPLSPGSKQPCSRGDPTWALFILFWCFSSFVDSHWKYAKINVSTVLVFKSHFQSSQHKTNLKILVPSRPFWPLGVVPLHTTYLIPQPALSKQAFSPDPSLQNAPLPCFPAPVTAQLLAPLSACWNPRAGWLSTSCIPHERSRVPRLAGKSSYSLHFTYPHLPPFPHL